jgi:hypothetical protein
VVGAVPFSALEEHLPAPRRELPETEGAR